jgi:hypothetical protein
MNEYHVLTENGVPFGYETTRLFNPQIGDVIAVGVKNRCYHRYIIKIEDVFLWTSEAYNAETD